MPAADAPPSPANAARRRTRAAGTGKLVAGGAVLGLLVLAAVAAPLIDRHAPLSQDLANRLSDPSWQHWFGTDEVGRDVWSRCLHAIRVDVALGVVGAAAPAILGTCLGAIAGSIGGWADAIVMRTADAVQAFPFHIFLIALVFALGAGPRPFLVAITSIGWVAYARLMRSAVLRLRRADFIAAAELSGFSRRRIVVRHLLPNALPQTLIYLAGDVVVVLLTLAAVSFFGLGVQPPNPEWGQMIATGAKYVQREWWMSVFPGLMIVLTGVGFTLLADGLDDRMRAP